jgi:hypothetical protein
VSGAETLEPACEHWTVQRIREFSVRASARSSGGPYLDVALNLVHYGSVLVLPRLPYTLRRHPPLQFVRRV